MSQYEEVYERFDSSVARLEKELGIEINEDERILAWEVFKAGIQFGLNYGKQPRSFLRETEGW